MLLSPILTVDPAKLERDLSFLMGCLRDVLDEAGERELSAKLPWMGVLKKTPGLVPGGTDEIDPDRLSQAYSIAFHLLSMAEQNAAVQQQRLTEAERGLTAIQALWGQCLQQLVDRGLTPSQIADALPRMSVELVLTAHPTEAKRTIVLEHHRALYLLLVKRENRMWTPYEQEAIRDEIRSVLSLLWRTGEIFLQKPDVAVERRNILHYLTNVVSRGTVRARSPAASDVGAPGFRRRCAPVAGVAPALQPRDLGWRRSRRSSTRHGPRHGRDSRRPAAARAAASAAPADGTRASDQPLRSVSTAAAGAA